MLFSVPSISRYIYAFHSSIIRVIFQAASFTHPISTSQEMNNGCIILIDSGADSCVSGKHGHVLEFIEGKEVNASSWGGYKTNRLRIANVAYAYDKPTGETIILVFNQSIYAGSQAVDSIASPIQCLLNDIKTGTRPKLYYSTESSTQKVEFEV